MKVLLFLLFIAATSCSTLTTTSKDVDIARCVCSSYGLPLISVERLETNNIFIQCKDKYISLSDNTFVEGCSAVNAR
jgi:hypothetical protein